MPASRALLVSKLTKADHEITKYRTSSTDKGAHAAEGPTSRRNRVNQALLLHPWVDSGGEAAEGSAGPPCRAGL
jgi:hypothetical protein